MPFFGPRENTINRVEMEAQQQALIENPENVDLLQRYYHGAVASSCTDEAELFLRQLQNHNPWNHRIRELIIALCLLREDYAGAMDDIETLVAFSKPSDALIDSAVSVRNRLGPRCIAPGPTDEPTISLCMIVKNEQAVLGPCLRSVKSLVDEMVVVDTGSSDRTADIARIFGAHVYDRKWKDDFSAARNASLQKASGRWVLILDADEVIASQDHAKVRQTIQENMSNPCAYSMQTRNYSNLANAVQWHANDGSYPQHETGIGWFPTRKVRLFPHSDVLRFRYPVHELVEPSARAAGIPIKQCKVPIHHYGHINEVKNTQKARRYFKLGYAKLEQLGNDFTAIRELAIQAGQLNRWAECVDLWIKVLNLSPEYGEAYVNLSGAHWQQGQYQRALACARKAVRLSPEIKEGHYNLAVSQLLGGQATDAVSTLGALLNRHTEYLAAEFMLAAATSMAGHHQEAQARFTTLRKKISHAQLEVALDELTSRLNACDKQGHARLIAKAAGRACTEHAIPDQQA